MYGSDDVEEEDEEDEEDEDEETVLAEDREKGFNIAARCGGIADPGEGKKLSLEFHCPPPSKDERLSACREVEEVPIVDEGFDENDTLDPVS